MSPHRFRFTIGQILASVAVLAVAMAFVGPRFAPALVAILLAPTAAFVAARRRWGVARCRIAGWLLVAYPPVLLVAHHSSWAIACGMLGRRPGPAATDQPEALGFPVVDLECIMVLLLLGSIPAALCCIGFVLADFLRSTSAGGPGPGQVVLIASAVASWFLLFVIGTADPAGTMTWFID